MILDMHVHTAASDDSTATIEGYIELIQAYREHHPFHGFVLTEHRNYTPGLNLQRYWDSHGVRIFQGVEMDTNLGHLLVYGLNQRVLEQFTLPSACTTVVRIIPQLRDLGALLHRPTLSGVGVRAHHGTRPLGNRRHATGLSV